MPADRRSPDLAPRDARPADAGGAGGTAGAGGSADAGDAAAGPALATELQELSWAPRTNAIFSLDVQPSGQAFVAPCVGPDVLADRLSYRFDGHCTTTGADITAPAVFRLCASVPAAGSTAWNAANAECVTVDYGGGPQILFPDFPDSATARDGKVLLRWPRLPAATYALHLHLAGGATVDNCVGAGVLADRTAWLFDGTCPTGSTATVPLASVASFEVDSAANGQWTVPGARDVAQAAYAGQAALTLPFAAHQDLFFAETCRANPGADLVFSGGLTFDADTCAVPGLTYTKRRLPDRSDYAIASYPRVLETPAGTHFTLFATPSGGFRPGGQTGCPELNLLRTRDGRNVQSFQLERLCGFSRLDNGEMALVGGKLYIPYHVITGNGGCTTSSGAAGRRWTIRMKVSANFESAAPTFTDVTGAAGFEDVFDLCLPNASNDGFWEPFVYADAADGFHVAYSDDTPPEIADGQCNQLIRVLSYDLQQRRVTASVAVGACPGDRRDGMPVVMPNGAGQYFMSIESLGAPSSQVVLLSSDDGGLTFPHRTVVADTAIDGGTGMGCPYLGFEGNAPLVSFYHLYLQPSSGVETGAFELRALDESLNKRGDTTFEIRRHWSSADDLDVLYWGGFRLEDGRLHAIASSWSHPLTEAWLPLP